MEEDSSGFHVFTERPPVFSVREPSDGLKSCFSYNFSGVVFSESDWKKKIFCWDFFKYQPRSWWQSFVWGSHVQLTVAFCRADTEEVKGRGEAAGKGNGRFPSSVFKCLFPPHTPFKLECTCTAARGTWLHSAGDGGAHHWLCTSQKKAILLSSNSIRIIYLLKDRKEWIEDQNHQPYLASSKIYGSCFQGQLEKTNCGIHICTISCLSIFYKCYEQSQPLGTLKLNNLYPSPILEWMHISIIAIFNYSHL